VGPRPRPTPVLGIEKPPLFEYPHADNNNCVIGGYVYRGPAHAAKLGGRFIFGDNGSGRIWSLTTNVTGPPTITFLCHMPPGVNYSGLSSFGVDRQGELYL